MDQNNQQQPQQPIVPQAAPLAQQASAMPGDAADIDLIEKEWVEHLEQIIAATRHDPFLQQQEISRAKADYMRKRYGKEVKVTE